MRTRTTRILLALLATTALVASTAPADATEVADPAIPITMTTVLRADGHGWGHGHGMSQYGAQGAARQGLRYDQILAFYYPGTAFAAASPRVRVLITGDTDDNTTVRAATGLKLVDLARGRSYRLPTTRHPRAWRLKAVNGRTRVYYKTASWHRYWPGGRGALGGAGQFTSTTGLVTLRTPAGDRTYRGVLRYVNRDTVNVVSLDGYVKGVVPSEMPSSWKPAALQAQAVAARTYAAFERAANASRYYQICDTTACQVYRGYSAEAATTNAAVDVTAGRILTSAGAPAFTQFSASSGGWTSYGGRTYLPYQQDIYDKAVTGQVGDPYFSWSAAVDVDKLRAVYGSAHTLTSVRVYRDAPYASGGRVTRVELTGNAVPATKVVYGSDFRTLFGLRSTYFTVVATTP